MRWKPTLPFHEGNMTPGESLDNPVARTFTLPREGEVIQHKESNYYLGKYIGEGSWGVVFHCTDDWENELVAKILKPRNRTYEFLMRTAVFRSVSVLK
jgi:hypothetical protein